MDVLPKQFSPGEINVNKMFKDRLTCLYKQLLDNNYVRNQQIFQPSTNEFTGINNYSNFHIDTHNTLQNPCSAYTKILILMEITPRAILINSTY